MDFRDPPPNGGSQVIFRCKKEDKEVIKAASRLMEMTDSQFMRTAVILAAREIVARSTKHREELEPVARTSTDFDPDLPPGVE